MTAAAPAPVVADRPLVGVLLMIGFCMTAPAGDAIAKVLGALPLGQVLAARYAMQAVILLPLVFATGRSLRLAPRVWRLTALRTVLHIASLGCFFVALRFLPMADAVAITFVMPFILLLLGHVLLGEAVGPHRFAACAVGFLGTLMVVQPSFAEVGAPALLPLAVALLFSLFMLVTRRIARDADPLVLQGASGLIASAILVPLALVALGSDWPEIDPVALPAGDWLLLALLGTFGTGAHLLMTWSLRFAPSATLAPMQYLEIPFATLLGYLVFDDLPNGLAAVGIAVTIGAGLYMVHRERLASVGRNAVIPAAPPTA